MKYIEINAPISNEYGVPYCWEENGTFYFAIGCAGSEDDKVKVSREFYDAWCKEFFNYSENEDKLRKYLYEKKEQIKTMSKEVKEIRNLFKKY